MTEDHPKISVVVPAYNERWRLPATLFDILMFFESYEAPYEVLIVDDGSTDDTTEVVKRFERYGKNIFLIQLGENRGKGFAVKTGMLKARGERVLFADADGSTPIEELLRLEAALKDGYDLAFASRAVASSDTQVETRWYRKYLGRSFNLCVNMIILPGIQDTQCGFKLFTREAAQFLFSRQSCDGFGFDVEILFLARKAGMKLKEIPVNWTNVPGSKVNLIVDSIKMFIDILGFRFKHFGVKPSDFRASSSHS